MVNAHYPALFLGGFLFFLGFTRATAAYQSQVSLRAPLLVGFFLGGLVIHGGLQGWWIAPTLASLSETPLFVGATLLTAVNDNALITYLATLVHIFRRFSPELFEQIQVAIEKGRVSRLEGIDQKQLHFELIELMTSEKLYMDDSLTLAKLAEELDIKPHQLSEFLNRYMGMNFNRFINHLRIEKAVKLLLESPGTNILDVAFECGFKSKAAFNAAFSSFKGMPPTKYIEQKRRSLPAESPES